MIAARRCFDAEHYIKIKAGHFTNDRVSHGFKRCHRAFLAGRLLFNSIKLRLRIACSPALRSVRIVVKPDSEYTELRVLSVNGNDGDRAVLSVCGSVSMKPG